MTRHCYLTTTQLHELNHACKVVRDGFGGAHPYLVGTVTEKADYRDVDVRVILADDEFDRLFGDQRGLWDLICFTTGSYLARATGLPIDFQVQRMTEANEKYGGRLRHPLAMGRSFAGGGDATRFDEKESA